MSAAPPRTVHVERCMGTVFSIDVRDSGDWSDALVEVVAWLHRVDAVFSTYRADSDVSRLARGELRAPACAPEVAEVLQLCAEASRATGGAFNALAAGRLDPSGLVKGWAVEHASALLRARGSANHAVVGGGDMQLAGCPEPGRPWRVGVNDPGDPASVLAVVAGHDLAVATSGTSQRGEHITDPFTGRPARGGATSVTVTGPRLTFADAYATAAFVAGDDAAHWLRRLPGYEALGVRPDGTTWCTPGFPVAERVASTADSQGGPSRVATFASTVGA